MSKNKNRPIHSAQAVAALRAATAKEKDPTVRGGDYLARHFIGTKYTLITSIRPQWLLRAVINSIVPGSYCFSITRTRHFDEALVSETEKGIQQVVILGAGYDTRALRFKEQLKDIPVFEIDLPSTQAYKIDVLASLGEEIPANLVFIPVDFNEENYENALMKAGFSKAKATLFLCEGLSYYLPKETFKNVLRFVSTCAINTSIVFDYVIRDFVKGNHCTYAAKKAAQWQRKINEPFLWGLNEGEVTGFLKEFNLKVSSDYGPEDLINLYLRNQEGRVLGATLGHARMAHAKVITKSSDELRTTSDE